MPDLLFSSLNDESPLSSLEHSGASYTKGLVSSSVNRNELFFNETTRRSFGANRNGSMNTEPRFLNTSFREEDFPEQTNSHESQSFPQNYPALFSSFSKIVWFVTLSSGAAKQKSTT